MSDSSAIERGAKGGGDTEDFDWHCMDCGASGFGNYRDHACSTLDHQAAIDAIVGALSVTVLSYQEAIEGYLKLRGIHEGSARGVWVVEVVKANGSDFLVFSSKKNAMKFAEERKEGCVISTRVIDCPERYYEVPQ